ncbi:MAG: hypothetical protein ABI876_00895 [Bacteroidota bacterium]
MALDVGNFGSIPAGATAERTFDIYYSTRVFAGGADVPTKITFFDARTTPADPIYSNLQLPSPNTVPIRVIGMKVVHDLLLDPANSGAVTDLSANAMQRTLDDYSMVRWERERKGVTGVPLFNLLPYEYFRDGSTLKTHEKQDWTFFKLPKQQQIDIKPGARVTFWIDAPASLKFGVNATAPSYLPYNGLTNQRGHRITFYLYTQIVQELQ